MFTIELSPFQIAQRRVGLVFIGQNQLSLIKRLVTLERGPGNTYLGVIPHEAALVAGMVDIVAFIAKLSDIAKDQKAMGESTRNKELPLIIGGKNGALPLAISFAIFAKIDGDIKDCTRNNTHELRLRMFDLKVQTA